MATLLQLPHFLECVLAAHCLRGRCRLLIRRTLNSTQDTYCKQTAIYTVCQNEGGGGSGYWTGQEKSAAQSAKTTGDSEVTRTSQDQAGRPKFSTRGTDWNCIRRKQEATMTEYVIETTSHGKCLMIRGFRFPPAFNPQFVQQALDLTPRAGDVFVSTYIKCGTTWVQYVVWCLHNLDKLASGEGVPTLNDLLHKHVPMIDWVGTEPLAHLPEPRLMKHHLPFHMTPYHPEAKYVVVVRNPFDCAVSFYHMRKNNWASAGLQKDYTFDAFFESFMTGDLPYGSYFDHVLSWYEHRNDPNVHLLFFEHLREDTAAEVFKIADFVDAKGIGSRLRSDPALLETVIEKTSFTSLRKTAVPDEDVGDKDIGGWDKPRGPSRNFFRKGVVGDWKNQMSADQERRLKEVYFARLGGTEFQKVWEKYLGF